MASEQLKLVLLGDSGVGKTSLTVRWSSDEFHLHEQSTIGGAAITVNQKIHDKHYSFIIWDTAGQERYRALTPMYMQNSYAALIVFDITKRTSFDAIDNWISLLNENGSIPFIIVGNKQDLSDRREVSQEEILRKVNSLNSKFFATSALSGEGVDLAFREAAIKAVELLTKTFNDSSSEISLQANGPKVTQGESEREKNCC